MGGCDRQSGQQAQPQQANSPQATPAAPQLPTGALDRSHKGSPLPKLTFRNPAGQQLPLATHTGKPLLINLWATWCAPCVAELPMLDQLAAAKAGKITVLAISQDLGEPAKVASFLADRHLDHITPWLDPDNALSSTYQVSTLPTTIYYDAQGHELWRYTGGRDWLGKETQALLAEAAGG